MHVWPGRAQSPLRNATRGGVGVRGRPDSGQAVGDIMGETIARSGKIGYSGSERGARKGKALGPRPLPSDEEEPSLRGECDGKLQ